ncbi:hypothetical protein CCR75_002027 [Bremia lactucae]|uniref:CRAL-TRIO domain-containing protein n=1 Tax=Bremia lactucae TaxID=4779 RepID=A0A976IBA3_BRELC|nr:hypothetical protein CCR75_002027 [Bremia lactucae]
MACFSCCRGVNARMLFLTACAMVDYIAHTVVMVLGPMLTLHFYPETSFLRLGFYTAIISGSGYLGHALSCGVWISLARSLKSSKGVIFWGLAVTGVGFFCLLLCKSLLAMSIVRFATGLSSGVLPVALFEIDNICGSRQTDLACMTKTLGVGLGACGTFAFIMLDAKAPQEFNADSTTKDSSMIFYPFCFVAVLAWSAALAMLTGLSLRSRASYSQLAKEEEDCLNSMPQFQNDTHCSPCTSNSLRSSISSSESSSPMATTVTHVKSAFEEAFSRSGMGIGLKKAMTTSKKSLFCKLLATPQPHFRLIRGMLPHHFHGYTSDGHLIVWDFVGRIKMDKLYATGFTTADLRDHYRFFLAFAQENLLCTSSQKIVYIIDLDGLSLRDVDARAVDSACAVVKLLQCDLPDRLQALAVLNSPVWFSQVMTSIRPHLAKRTAEKVSFLSKSTMKQDLIALVGVDSLPQRYGGRNGVEIGKSVQERSLDDLLKRTTASLESTIEIVATPRSQRSTSSRSRISSVCSDEGSDEEAFFDCSEYGLQSVDDIEGQEPIISVVVHSHISPSSKTEAVTRSNTYKSGAYRPLEKKQTMSSRPLSGKFDKPVSDLAITREPQACLVLLIYFLWSVFQLSFDELLPLWFFKQISRTGDSTVDERPTSHLLSVTLTIAGTLASLSLFVLFGQILSNIVCHSSRNIMTPLATLRIGLLLQIPILGCFPLLDLFEVNKLPFSWLLVLGVLIAKQLVAGVALHGIMTLLDNSIAVDKRLTIHRVAQRAHYVSHFIASSAAPALFALLGFFQQAFPFDQSLLYYIQALGLMLLFVFTIAIPSRMNFPVLFSMGKLSFLSKSTMKQDLIALVGVDSLPQRYGGRNGVEIGKSVQERSLDDLLKRTTASLESTIEIVATPRSQRSTSSRSRISSVCSDEGSDEEAFFDCSEYGLQSVDDIEGQEPIISVVVHSHISPSSKTEAVTRSNTYKSGAYRPLEKKQTMSSRPLSGKFDKPVSDLAITREPQACLVLLIYFLWSVFQLSFDELLPLWFFKQISRTGDSTVDERPTSHLLSVTLTIAGTLASLSLFVLFGQILSNIVCHSSRNIMTPLATLRIGLLLQIPILGCFPLLDLFEVNKLPFSWLLVLGVLIAKQLVAGVALHGIMTLLDNSIAVDKRLTIHRVAQRAHYVSHFIASSAAPALFALLGFFQQAFPFDQSLLYYIQALGLMLLFVFTIAIPSRMNFPVLFSMGKR